MDIINKGGYILTDNEILDYMTETAVTDNMPTLEDMTTHQFNYILTKAGRKFFEHSNIIQDVKGNILDYDILYNIAMFYTSLCHRFNKVISIGGYSKLTMVDYFTLESFKDYNITSKEFRLVKLLDNNRQDYIKDKLIDSNNVVGAIAVANNEYKWTSPDTGSNTTINIIGGAELPSMIEALNNKGLSVPAIPNNAITNDHAVNSYQ